MSPILFAISLEPLAAAIHNNSNILGVIIDSHEFKLHLFADDTVVYLRDPLSSLPHLMSEFETFSQISGFTINQSKLEIYPVAISDSLKHRVQSHFLFKWVQSAWRHLGIQIPLDLKNLFSVNYTPLMTWVRAILQGWEVKFFTWLERIELVKSMILPQFLFLFQSLPLNLFPTTLKKWQSVLNKFVWSARRPRIGFHLISKPSSRGGFGHSDLNFYYAVAQLRAIYFLLKVVTPPVWVHIEESYPKPFLLKDVIWNTHKFWPSSVGCNPFLLLTLKIWDQYRGLLAPVPSPVSSFLGQEWFPPARPP